MLAEPLDVSERYVVGICENPGPVPPELRKIMEQNSAALEEMLQGGTGAIATSKVRDLRSPAQIALTRPGNSDANLLAQ